MVLAHQEPWTEIAIRRAQRLKGAVFDLCRDQHGSRYVQTRLETAPDDEVRAIPPARCYRMTPHGAGAG